MLSNDEVKSGLIFDPIKNEMFYAEKNNGAFFNNERIRVSKKNELSECLFATGGKKYNSINEISTRKSGCAALDLAYVASGRYDGYCQNNLNLWDIAAGLIILREAGGVINDIDLVLIMSVNPGFGGQSFIHSSLEKISQVRKMIDDSGKDIRLEVDGGINKDTIGLASKAGADTFVAGSAIFNTENYEQTISELRSKIN